MQLLQKLLNKLNGLYYKQDYLCLSKEAFQQSLQAYLISGSQIIRNITDHHLFIGYNPLVFAFSKNRLNLSLDQQIDIVFCQTELKPNDQIDGKGCVAILSLKKIYEQEITNDIIVYYEGQRGGHKFISSFRQLTVQWQNRLYNKKPGNVFLAGNLLKQVQIAYSLPRTISLITVGLQHSYNLFPTDLHGQINDEIYIISLRLGGKAAQQVGLARKILVAEIDSSFYKTVYSLGKNHMQDLKTKDQFPFGGSFSDILKLPLPESVVNFRELELQQSFDHGIHRFFLFWIISKRQIVDKSARLAHIHNVYATWRHNNGLAGNYLLR